MRPKISIKHGIEKLSSHSGLLHIGALLSSTNLMERLNSIPDVYCQDPKFLHADILFSMTGLISIGKPYYDAIDIFRDKPDFFINALKINQCPSSPTIRQRIDLIGHTAENIIKEESAALIKSTAPAITPVNTSAGNFIPLDIDVTPFDNSKTHKEGVSRTYKGYDGYSPIFGYFGTEGYLIDVQLREGKQHCQKDTPQFIQNILAHARQITDQPILMRLDSGNDSKDNFPDTNASGVHFIIKRNLRRESRDGWIELAKKQAAEHYHYPTKSVWIGKTSIDLKGNPLPFPIAFKVTELHMKKGQQLLFPEYEIDTYWCDIEKLPAKEIIDLYHDHGTSEQFHSEIKTDMDLERLPSKNFSSNSLVLHLGMLAYNMLRIIGQLSLEENDKSEMPYSRRKSVKRRRIRTVMQDLIYMAGRVIKSGRRLHISFGCLNPFAKLFERIFDRLKHSPPIPI